MLYYVPLEQIPERYTYQLSKPVDGWMEKNFREAAQIGPTGYKRIDGIETVNSIKVGQVLDAVGRSVHCFKQTTHILELMQAGQIRSDDILYFDDFWHPGIESIAYLGDQIGVRPKMFSYLWAQSVDEFDFTYKMLPWIRHFEKGIASLMTGIFVCSPVLQDLVVKQGLAPLERVHNTGCLPVDVDEIRSRMPREELPRTDTVLFTSRWDAEKDPLFFLTVAREYHAVYGKERPCEFVVTTSAPKLRSNNPVLLVALRAALSCGNVSLLEGLTKEEYYKQLKTAKIQFNCANQDFISFTLIEALVAETIPLYPDFRSFPYVLDSSCLYRKGDVQQAVRMIRSAIEHDYTIPHLPFGISFGKTVAKLTGDRLKWKDTIPSMIRTMLDA